MSVIAILLVNDNTQCIMAQSSFMLTKGDLHVAFLMVYFVIVILS
jgi:hypothetical protein